MAQTEPQGNEAQQTRLAVLNDSYGVARWELREDLIRHTHEAGVGVRVLSRWFDLAHSRVSEIVK
jgi:hypothetical protein